MPSSEGEDESEAYRCRLGDRDVDDVVRNEVVI